MNPLDVHLLVLDWFREAPTELLEIVEEAINTAAPIDDLEDPERWKGAMEDALGWIDLAAVLAPDQLCVLEKAFRPFPVLELAAMLDEKDALHKDPPRSFDYTIYDVFWDDAGMDPAMALVEINDNYVSLRPGVGGGYDEVRLSDEDLEDLLDLLRNKAVRE